LSNLVKLLTIYIIKIEANLNSAILHLAEERVTLGRGHLVDVEFLKLVRNLKLNGMIKLVSNLNVNINLKIANQF